QPRKDCYSQELLNPFVTMKMDSFAPARQREQKEGTESDGHAKQFEQRGMFGQNGERPEESPNRTGRANGRSDGNGQVLYRKIGADPRGGNQQRLENQLAVLER